MRVDMESLQENLNKARALQEDKPLVISAKKRLPRKNPHHTIHTLLDDNQYAEVSSWQGLRDSQEDFSDIVIFEKVPALSAEELAQIYYDCLIELEYMIEQEPTLNKKQGATYTGTLQFGRSIIAANIGDSASNVITVHDSYYSAIALTWPQNCLDEDEKQRVLLAGGMISDERIGGILAVSRALGDTDYERHGLIHEPEMSHIELEQGTKAFIVNCSDGLTDVMNEGCIADFFAQNGLRKGAENLAKTAIRRGSYDNVTVSLVPVIEAENKLVLSQVIDGHAGDKVAEYANIHLPKLLASKLSNDLTVVKMRSLTQEYAHVNQSPDDYRHNSILTILDSTIHDQRLAIKPEHRKLIIHLQYLRAEVQEQLQAYGKVNDYTQTEEYQLAVLTRDLVNMALSKPTSPELQKQRNEMFKAYDKLYARYSSKRKRLAKGMAVIAITCACVAVTTFCFCTAVFFLSGGPLNPASLLLALATGLTSSSAGLSIGAAITTPGVGLAAGLASGLGLFKNEIKRRIHPTNNEKILMDCRALA